MSIMYLTYAKNKDILVNSVKKNGSWNLKTIFPYGINYADQKNRIQKGLITRKVEKGTIIHNGNMDCTGLLLVKSGQLRAYIFSDEEREITIYCLFDRDMCLFSVFCMMRSIQFDVTIVAGNDTKL